MARKRELEKKEYGLKPYRRHFLKPQGIWIKGMVGQFSRRYDDERHRREEEVYGALTVLRQQILKEVYSINLITYTTSTDR